jgi:hypothetical protein
MSSRLRPRLDPSGGAVDLEVAAAERPRLAGDHAERIVAALLVDLADRRPEVVPGRGGRGVNAGSIARRH